MKKHLLMSLAIVTLLGYFYFNFIGTLSQNVIPVTAKERNVIKFFFPQGWGFFTKNPREPKYKLYKLREQGTPQLVNFKITSPKNLLGLSRKGNRVCIEMIRLQSQLPKVDEWATSPLDINQFDFDKNDFEVIDPGYDDLFYITPGKYVIQEYRLTPWNWLKYPDNYSPEYKYYSFELNESK